MPLHINLLHEEQSKVVERKRDPLKLGILAMLVVAAIFYAYYLTRKSSSEGLAKERAALEAQLAAVAPKAEQAKLDAAAATAAMAATTAVEKLINDRFYWGPLFTEILGGTGPEIQITGFDGALRSAENVTFTVIGVSAGREPRAVAERLRQNLEDRLKKVYGTVASQFVSLENSETPLILNGKSFATANFTISFQITLETK
jgi:Tfp pilus assembly protein PilN